MADLLAPFIGEQSLRLAERLIDRYGGLSAALAVDASSLADRELAEGCRLIQAAHRLTVNAAQERLQGTPVRADDHALKDYLQITIGGAREERFHAVFADRSGNYLRDEPIAEGHCSGVGVPARSLFRRALELGANFILLAHNHPSGRCYPSAADIATTEHLRSAGACLEVHLIDHLIVTRDKVFSMHAGALL